MHNGGVGLLHEIDMKKEDHQSRKAGFLFPA